MPSFFTSGNTAALTGASRGCSRRNTRSRGLPFSSGTLSSLIRLAQEGQRRPIGAGRRLDHVRHEALAGDVVEVRQVLAAAAVARLAFGILLDDQRIPFAHELAFHVAAQVEVAAMGDSFQLAELARRQERKGIFDVGGAAGVMAQLVLVVVAQDAAARRPGPARYTSGIGGRASTCTTRATGWDGRRTRSPSARTRASGR